MVLESPYRNPGRWRAVIYQNDVRHGTAGCMLSLILLAPLFVPSFGFPLVAAWVLIYGCFIVPALTNYFSAKKLVLRLIRLLQDVLFKRGVLSVFKSLLRCTSSALESSLATSRAGLELLVRTVACLMHCYYHCFLPSLHNFYVGFEGVRITTNQVVFFLFCERILLAEGRLISLHLLMLYTILAYLHNALFSRQWSQNLRDTNMRDLIRLTTWFMAARLGKGVAMSFVLAMFTMKYSREELSLSYVLITFFYFIITQKRWTGNERIISWTKALDLDNLAEEEDFWVPYVFKSLSLSLSTLVLAASLWRNDALPLCLLAVYTNLIVPWLLLEEEYQRHMAENTRVIQRFRKASSKDLESDSTCPVCLEALTRARVTPCGHLYHGGCLRQCLSISPLCPLCKQNIL